MPVLSRNAVKMLIVFLQGAYRNNYLNGQMSTIAVYSNLWPKPLFLPQDSLRVQVLLFTNLKL